MEPVGKCATGMEKGTFTPADVVAVFDATWLDEAMCNSWVMLMLHHAGVGCPGCGAGLTEAQRGSFFDQRRVRCAGCGKYFSATSGTFLSGVQIDFRQLVLMFYLIGIGVDDATVAAAVNLDKTTVWRYRKQAGAVDE